MAEKIQAIRGMNDILPTNSSYWRFFELAFIACVERYGYNEIRMPILESTQLFKRTIGEMTDIVEKEMYTFNDLNGDSVTMRPEGTAGCVRACLEHGLLHNQQQKLWYGGPMFRHEKPQKGRYRQFHQVGVEVFGIDGVGIELELIALCKRFWDILGVGANVTLQINTIGDAGERRIYREQLVAYLEPFFAELDCDSQRRLSKNPLRILDSKNPQTQAILASAPTFLDVLSESAQQYFAELCRGLDKLDIAYTVNPQLVRGLDYYSHTVFEWVTDKLGSQATVCAGGRYDQLVSQLGGAPTPAVGFAMGVERLLLLMETLSIAPTAPSLIDIFIVATNNEALLHALTIAEMLREDWVVLVNLSGGSFKSQFKKADKSGARIALILGEDEMQTNTISIKDLRAHAEQETLPQQGLCEAIKTYFRR